MKKKPLLKRQIPRKYHKRVKFNIGSFSLGNYHHQQLCSKVYCGCGTFIVQRNLRILQSVEKYGEPFVCRTCVWERFILKIERPSKELLEKIIKLYMDSDLSWNDILIENNLSDQKYWILQQINYSYLTKLRRFYKKREKLNHIERVLLEKDKYLLDRQREDLNKMENSIKALLL